MSWSVILKHDGEAIVEAPVDEWTAATVLADVTVALWGGPVSLGQAVVTSRPSDSLTIFDALEEVA